jgi:hypothetical protein
MGKSKGFLESLFDDLAEELVYHAVTEMARDEKGKVDPFAAAGIAYGLKGDLSDLDLEKLGRTIGAKGGFDSEDE